MSLTTYVYLINACLNSVWAANIPSHYCEYSFWCAVDAQEAILSWPGLVCIQPLKDAGLKTMHGTY